MDFGLKLKKLRQMRNLTQCELADEIGISVGSIANIESNSRKPSKEMAIRLSSFFDNDIYEWIPSENTYTKEDIKLVNILNNSCKTKNLEKYITYIIKKNLDNTGDIKPKNFSNLKTLIEQANLLNDIDNLEKYKDLIFNAVKLDLNSFILLEKIKELKIKDEPEK